MDLKNRKTNILRLYVQTKKARVDTSIPFVVTLSGHTGPVNAVAVVRNDLIASGSDDSTIKLWNPWTYTCEETLTDHTDAVTCLAVGEYKNPLDLKWPALVGPRRQPSPFVVSGSKDKTLKVWAKHEESGRWEHIQLGPPDAAVSCVAVMKNQQEDDMVVSGSDNGNIKFWDLATEKCIGVLKTVNQKTGKAESVRYVLPMHIATTYDRDGDARKFYANPESTDVVIVETGEKAWQLASRPPKSSLDSKDDQDPIKDMFSFASNRQDKIAVCNERHILNTSALLMQKNYDIGEDLGRVMTQGAHVSFEEFAAAIGKNHTEAITFSLVV
jgi:WD40 repeat protein